MKKSFSGLLLAGLVVSLVALGPVSYAAPSCNPTVTTETISGSSYQVAVFPAGSCVWAVPDGVTAVDVLVVGAGGGGGGGAAWNAGAHPGGGGGGGAFTTQLGVAVNAGDSASIVVGAGGAAGSPGINNGSGGNGLPGENSSISVSGTQVVSVGGSGGTGGNGAAGAGGASDTRAGGSGSGAQGGSGASAASVGGTTTASTPGVSSDFTGSTVVFGTGGGGATATGWPASGTAPFGGGSGGGRGGLSIYTYGYSNTAGAAGTVVVRWVSVKPDAPIDLDWSLQGEDAVLTWTAPTFTGSAALTGYRVEMNNGSGWNALTSPVTNSTATTYTAAGVATPGANLTFRVYAYSSSTGTYSLASAVSRELVIAPPPYSGPMVNPIEESINPGERLIISGKRLSTVTSVELDGISAAADCNDSSCSFTVPSDVAAGVKDFVLIGSHGKLTVQDALTISDSIGSSLGNIGLWTKKQDDGTVKMYAKNIVGAGKVQFFVNGKEIVWVRAADEADSKLRSNGAFSYLVRTVELVEGQKNVLEIYVDGVGTTRTAYTK